MKKKYVILVLLILLLTTACSNNMSTSIKDSSEKKEKSYLICNGTYSENNVIIKTSANIEYNKDSIVDGKYKIKLELNNPSDEEKMILKDLSLCSYDLMSDLVNYGKCTSKSIDEQLTSTLVIDKKLINDNIKINDLKTKLEKINNNKCIIK